MFSTKLLGALVGTSATVLLLAGCGSSDPDYYTLREWPGQAQPDGPASLKIRTPSVAGYLDRDNIVSGDHDYRLKLDQGSAWGEPLADMIGQTLSADLQQRLPGTNVFTQAGAISTEAQATVELDVSRFSKTNDGLVTLDASLSVQRAESGNASPAPARAVPLHLRMAPPGNGTAAEVAALSQLLGQVADEAARQARLIGPPLPVAMPPAQPSADASPNTVPVSLAPR